MAASLAWSVSSQAAPPCRSSGHCASGSRSRGASQAWAVSPGQPGLSPPPSAGPVPASRRAHQGPEVSAVRLPPWLPGAILNNDHEPGDFTTMGTCSLPLWGLKSEVSVLGAPQSCPPSFWWPQPCSSPTPQGSPLLSPTGTMSRGLGLPGSPGGPHTESLSSMTPTKTVQTGTRVLGGHISLEPAAVREQVWLMAASPATVLGGAAPRSQALRTLTLEPHQPPAPPPTHPASGTPGTLALGTTLAGPR